MKMSESVANIATALAKFQAEVKNPANTAANPFFKSKYAPLSDILNLVRPLLSKHGLSIVQMPSGDGENITVATLLLHESGEWIEACPLTLRADKTTAQGAGSAITYGRRYAMSALLGISSEDDDDGDQASKEESKKETKQKQENNSPEKPGNEEHETARKAMYAKAKELKFTDDQIKDYMAAWYNVDSTTKMTVEQLKDFRARLIKQVKENVT